MSRACGTFGGGMRNAYRVLVSKPDGTTTLAIPTFRWEDHLMDCSDSGQRQAARCCEKGGETSGSAIMRCISWPAEKLLVFS
jgi:hypothetical protein